MLGPGEKFLGRKLTSLNIVGGGAKSNIWCQIFADVLDVTIRQVANPIEVNARGAAFIAAEALGYMKFEDAAQ
jgi:xylulokinase